MFVVLDGSMTHLNVILPNGRKQEIDAFYQQLLDLLMVLGLSLELHTLETPEPLDPAYALLLARDVPPTARRFGQRFACARTAVVLRTPEVTW